MKAFLILFTFTVINIVVSLPPDPTLYAYLQSLVNPTGITDVGAMISQIPDDSHGLVILSPSTSRDFAYYTLNGTTAACDSQYSLSGGPGPALRQSGTCISQKDVSFLVECSNTTNTAGEQNWLYAIFNQTGTYFATYGSARAIFVPRQLPTPPIPTAGSTTGQAVTGEQSNNSSQNSAKLVSDIPNLNWTDTGYSKDENTIILSDCPVFTDISLYLD